MNEKIYALIKENESLIYKMASKYSSYYNIDDLYQAGCIGILKAYKNFDENSNIKFTSYAYKYILGEMVDFIKKDRNIYISDEVYSLYKKYLKVKELLSNKYNREASLREISNFIGISESEIVNVIETVAFTKTIDNEFELSIDERSNLDNKLLIDNVIESLNEFDKNLINFRYYQGYTQSETANLLGVNQVKVSREEKLILNLFKEKLKA